VLCGGFHGFGFAAQVGDSVFRFSRRKGRGRYKRILCLS
jgi:hypothetical protein